MKKLLMCGCIFFLCAAACGGTLGVGYYIYMRLGGNNNVQAKVVVEEGSVNVTHNGQTITVLTSSDLFGGDTVTTDASSTATILFANNSVTRLNTDTSLTITALDNGGNTINLELLTGQIWNRVQQVLSGGSFTVEGNGVIAAVRGTVFDFDASGNRRARVSVLNGIVGVRDPQSDFSEDITRDNFADIRADRQAIVDRIANAPLDSDWMRWNEERDAQIEEFLKNHPRLFDRLQQLYPGKFPIVSDSNLGPVSALPLEMPSEWSELYGQEVCVSYSQVAQAAELVRATGGLVLGAEGQLYMGVMDKYLTFCSDGVMSQSEYVEFSSYVNSLQ